jgi:hypothetical protein
MNAPASALDFDRAAALVLRRVLVRRWLGLFGQTARWLALAMLACVALRVFAAVGVWLPLVVLTAWLGATSWWVWQQRPGKYESLALWDQVGGRSEAFAAAWWFAQQRERTSAEQRHLEAQRALLGDALARLRQDLPVVVQRMLLLAPVLVLLALVAGSFRPLSPGDQPLSDAMQQSAAHEAGALKRDTMDQKKLDGLTEQEKREIEQLRAAVKSTADNLEKGKADSARGVLSELEKRAHDAERMAEKLGTRGDAWASDKLVAELRRHADTADLGDAVAAKKAPQAAMAAQALADQLNPAQAAREFTDRLTATLQDAAKGSETEDRQRIVGQHVLAASDELNAIRIPAAAKEFEKLAQKLGEVAKREQAQKELEKLAQQLRDAGSRITGQQGGGTSKMAQAGQSTQQQGQMQQQAQQAANAQPMQAPGLSQPSQMMQQAPPSSAGDGQQQSMALAQGQAEQGQGGMQSGQKPGEGKPMLLAPIPGAKPDKQPSAAIVAPNMQPPDGGSEFTLAAPGSAQPGNATAKLEGAKTAPTKTAQSSQVTAKSGSEGSSTMRSVEGGVRQENATQSSSETTVDFIKQQEAALDEAALPAARREQVRRYFGELRKRFEAK